MSDFRIEKIISGGQTGIDRAALDVALELDIPCGGWCPKGRAAEDGCIDARYPLMETESEAPEQRTWLNARDSDATLIISQSPLTGGTAYTRRCAHEMGRPVLVVDPEDPQAMAMVCQWLDTNRPQVLNIAGPRATGLCNGDRTLAAIRSLLRRVLREAINRREHRT